MGVGRDSDVLVEGELRHGSLECHEGLALGDQAVLELGLAARHLRLSSSCWRFVSRAIANLDVSSPSTRAVIRASSSSDWFSTATILSSIDRRNASPLPLVWLRSRPTSRRRSLTSASRAATDSRQP